MSNRINAKKLVFVLAVSVLFPSLFFGLKNVSAAQLPDPSVSPTVAPTETVTATPSPSPVISATATPMEEPTVTPTETPEPTPDVTVTDTPVPTEEPVETPTDTPIPTATPTPFSYDLVFENETITAQDYTSSSKYVELNWETATLPDYLSELLRQEISQPVYTTVFDYDTFSYRTEQTGFTTYNQYHSAPEPEGYVIYKVDAAGNEKSVAETKADTLSVKIKGLSPATRYRFAIRGKRTSDDGTKTVYTHAVYIDTVTCPSSPKMKSLNIGEQKASMSWSSVKCEGYELVSLYDYGEYYYEDSGITIASVKPGKTSVNLKRTQYKGLNPNFDPVKKIAKIGVRAFATDATGKRQYSTVSSRKTSVQTYIPSIVEVRENFSDGIKKLNKIKRGKSNTGKFTVYSFKTGYSPKKRSSYKMSFTAADKREVKKFANKYFEKNWTPGDKVAFTLIWINMNNTYDRSYKYSGRHSVGEVIFKYRYGQCLQYNGALVEMMNYLGYDAYLVASIRSNKGSWQHYRAFIKYKGKEYSCETGTYSSNGYWRWLMQKGDQMAAN